MKIVAIATTLLLTGLLLVQPALAEGDPESGKVLSYTCLGCHGIEGYRNAYPSYRVPRLGGQTAEYIAIALRGYRDGERKHPTMQGQASSLSDQDIDDIAAYFSNVGGKLVPADGTDGASFDAAATCVACHGQNGISVNPIWPTLAGQHESYLEHALHQYRNGERKNGIMAAQAMLIGEEDVARLAKYFAGLQGLETIRTE